MPHYNVVYATGSHYPETVKANSPEEAAAIVEKEYGSDDPSEFVAIMSVELVDDSDDDDKEE
jgi:hypothetical protein